MSQPHQITVMVRKDPSEGKWVIYIKGVTSGAEIHQGDELTVTFKLDASRFHPVIKQESL